MAQVGESVAVIPPGGTQKCVFCEKDHQDKKAASKHTFARDMSQLKREGRAHSIEHYSGRYPGDRLPPLTEWSKEISTTGGYKGAAHHCVALKTASAHRMSGELKAAGYEPNQGSNCMWLPYSRTQFIRARAYQRALQKHRGGHTDAYFQTVARQIEAVAALIEKKFCPDERPDKASVIRFMKQKEGQIWLGISNSVKSEYHLYNASYLDPKKPWGFYDEENGLDHEDYLGHPTSIDDDEAAEQESADDPE